MFSNRPYISVKLGKTAAAAALIALAGQAFADNAATKSAQPGHWRTPTAEEIAAVRATFTADNNTPPPAKAIGQPVSKPALKVTPWDRPRPQVPAGLRAAELPTYYLYNGKPVVMHVDTSRIAVKFAGITAQKGDELVSAAAAKLGIAVAKIVSPSVGNWRFIHLAAPLNDAGAVNAAIDLLLTDPSFEFASPVYDHPTIENGYIVITPLINVRVTEANAAADAEGALKVAAPTFDIATRGLGGLTGAYQLSSTERNGFRTLRAANQLAQDASIAWAEPDMLATMKLDFVPNDPGMGSMWGWDQANDIDTDAETAWDLTRGRSSVQVLVLDVGVEQNHPDINQNPGRDFTTGAVNGVAGGGPTTGCDRHGTSLGGIIAGRINNGIGGAGVCPNCRVLSAKTATEQVNPCTSSYAAFSPSWLANAIAWGQNQGAQISNSSFGVGQANVIDDAYDNAWNNGMIHFGAAGNGGADQIGDPALGYPASEASVNAVTAIDSDGGRSSFANWGTGLQFACPGTNVYTCDRQSTLGYNTAAGTAGDYTSFGGTSAATPFAAGICALIMSAFPDLPPASILSLMKTSSRDLGAAGYDTGFGWGFPNANTALRIFRQNDWCDTATSIDTFSYNPATFLTTGFNEVPDEPQESCEANGAGVNHTLWYSFIPPCGGTLDVNTNGSDYDTVLSIFRGTCQSPISVACNDDSNGTLQSQLTDVNVSAGLTYFIKVGAYDRVNGAGGHLSFHFLYSPTVPANDLCSNAQTIPFAPYTAHACTVGANNQICEDSGSCVGTGTSKSVWYEYTPTVNGKADIDTNGSGYDTVLTVWAGCPLGILFNGQLTCFSNTQLACDDDSGTGFQSLITGVVMKKGLTYKIKAAAYGPSADGGDLTLHFAYRTCPADHNGSGSVTVQDIFDFLADYFAGHLAADYNNSGTVTVQDIFDYLALYFSGVCN